MLSKHKNHGKDVGRYAASPFNFHDHLVLETEPDFMIILRLENAHEPALTRHSVARWFRSALSRRPERRCQSVFAPRPADNECATEIWETIAAYARCAIDIPRISGRTGVFASRRALIASWVFRAIVQRIDCTYDYRNDPSSTDGDQCPWHAADRGDVVACVNTTPMAKTRR